jgi:hypothetical protein
MKGRESYLAIIGVVLFVFGDVVLATTFFAQKSNVPDSIAANIIGGKKKRTAASDGCGHNNDCNSHDTYNDDDNGTAFTGEGYRCSGGCGTYIKKDKDNQE